MARGSQALGQIASLDWPRRCAVDRLSAAARSLVGLGDSDRIKGDHFA